MVLNPNEASFLGCGFELVLYGLNIALFSVAVVCLIRKRRTSISTGMHKFYLFSCCLLFSCCTIHVFIKFRYLYKDLSESPNATGTLEAGTNALRAADTLFPLTDWFAELVLMYRCWTIWQRNYYIIILPLLTSLAFVSCSMSIAISLLTTFRNDAIVPKSLVPLGLAGFAMALIFNFMVTALIIGRIWYEGRQRRLAMSRSGGIVSTRVQSYIKDSIDVVVESGMLYLIVQLVFTVLFAINHPAQIILSDMAVQIYGIAPTLIIVRVGLGSTFGTPSSSGSVQLSLGPSHGPTSTSRRVLGRPGQQNQGVSLVKPFRSPRRSNEFELSEYKTTTLPEGPPAIIDIVDYTKHRDDHSIGDTSR